MTDWTTFLSAMTLALVRVSGMLAFAPFFSSSALPMRTKAVFAGSVAFLVTPLVASLPGAQVELSLESILGELAVGLVYGLSLALLVEMLVFAGQIVGMQLSFSLVNLLDPNSSVETPIMGELFRMLGILVVIGAGLDRIMLASVLRSFRAVPPGLFRLGTPAARTLVGSAGGVFLAALELAAPVLAATVLVETAIALLGKLSPQLPVMMLSVPLKTLVGFGILMGALALWPRFIEARFDSLLDMAQRLVAAPGAPATGWGG